jgi:hypothetical protein
MRKVLLSVAFGAALAVVVGASPSARADVIYDNFGPGDTYQTNIGWTIGGPPGTPFWEQGDPFTVSGSWTLTQVTLAAGYVLGDNVYTVWLMDDNGGQPGNVIEEFDFAGLGPFGSFNPPLVAASALNPTLDDGATYWLVSTTSMGTWTAWNLNNTGDVGAHAQRTDGGPWNIVTNTRGAYRIEADPITAASGSQLGREPQATTDTIDPDSITIIPE